MTYTNNRSIKLVVLAVIIILSSCDSTVDEPMAEKIRPVKTVVVGDPGMGGVNAVFQAESSQPAGSSWHSEWRER